MRKMRKVIQVYLTNAKSVVEYNSSPSYTVRVEDEPDKYWVGQGCIHLGQVEVEFPKVPERGELTALTVEALKAKIQEVRANAEQQVNHLQQSINDLLMIGHDTSEVAGTAVHDDDFPF